MQLTRYPFALRSMVLLGIVALLLSVCGGGLAMGPEQGTAQPQATQPAAQPGATQPGESPGQGDVPRGGTLTIAYKGDLATLDPAVGYDWTN
ncbi:MAG: hypothetical protein QJR03_07830 [Sphaerobacter sp.]|nr:hypothetical protein [Sphaerobacter sp.]